MSVLGSGRAVRVRLNFAGRVALVLILLPVAALSVFAALTGDIRGRVLDPQKLPVAGAGVTLTNSGTGATRRETTDSAGNFSLLQLDLGTYQIRVEKDGFRGYVINNVVVSDGKVSEVRIALEVGALSDTVTVQGGAEAIFDLGSAQVSTSFDSRTIEGLPLANLPEPGGRDPIGIAQLAPGIVPVAAENSNNLLSGNFNADGQSARSNDITVDNVIATDAVTTEQAGLGAFSLDSIQEITVITSGPSAEFGRNSGSQVQIITKAGSNEFHGTAYGFAENSALNARDFFASSKAPFNEDVWGGNLGGHVIKNRVFAFVDYQGIHSSGASNTRVAAVLTPAQAAGISDPTSAALFEAVGAPQSASAEESNTSANTTKQYEWSIRLDENFNNGRDLFTERYGTNPVTGVTPALTFYSSSLPNYGAEEVAVNHFVNASYAHTFTSHIVNQARFEFAHDGFLFNAFTNLATPYAPVIDISGFPAMGVSPVFPQSRVQNVIQAGDTLSWAIGRHALKFGGDFYHYQVNSVTNDYSRGEFLYGSLAAFQSGEPELYLQGFGNPARDLLENDFALFAQDDIRVSRTFTLNLGLRFESPGGPHEANGLMANLQANDYAPLGGGGSGPLGSIVLGGNAYQRNENWAPRFGAAWNPNGGKLVVRGFYGWVYDFAFLEPVLDQQFSAPYFVGFDYGGASMTGANSYANFAAGTAPAEQAAAASVGTFPSSEVNFGNILPVQQNLKSPRTDQRNVGVEYQVSKDFVIKASYIGSSSHNLLVSMPINLIPAQNRPAPATSVADESARYSQFLSAYEYEFGTPSGSVVNDLLDHRFNSVVQVQSAGSASYNALQIQAIKLMRHGFSVQGSYTYGRSYDDVSDAISVYGNDSALVQNPLNLASNWGPSDFDIRSRFVANGVFEVPWTARFTGRRRDFLHGWGLDGIVVAQSGMPVTIFSGARLDISDVALVGGALGEALDWADGNVSAFTPAPAGSAAAAAIPRPCDRGVAGATPTPGNPDCNNVSGFPITQPLLGNFGDSGRNQLRLAGLSDFDMGFFKNTPIKEKYTVQFRWEIFNVFNHANFSGFVNTLTSPEFGTYTSTANNARNMQFALKFLF